MKLVTYALDQNTQTPRAGILTEAGIVDLQNGARQINERLPSDVVQFLENGEHTAEVAHKLIAAVAAGDLATIPEDSVLLLPALPSPTTIYLLAANYQAHITESGAAPVDKARITPRPFIKPNSSVVGTGDSISIPADSDTLDYEVEIAAVIGKSGKMIAEEDAHLHVAGYTVFNDISARSLKISEGRSERNGDWFFDWLLGKWCDGFSAIGPYLVTSDEVSDPRDLEMSLRVNGELRQHSEAGEMIFTVPETISFLSRFVTLRVGDMICMGTPGGVGDTTSTYLKHGDIVEATIDQLGSLTNRIVGAH